MPDPDSWNQQIIDEFRANEGNVGGQFEGAPLVLLTTTGAKSGRRHTTPVMYLAGDEGVIYVFASKAGAPADPDWYRNLVANPTVTVELGTDKYDAVAESLEGDERAAKFAIQARRYSGFDEYQDKTTRVIPVVALTRQ